MPKLQKYCSNADNSYAKKEEAGKMSFNFQVNQPIIQGAQQMQNNGGGGNLGYMQQGKKKKDKKENEINTNYLEQDEPDILQIDFEKDQKEENKKEENKKDKKNWIDNIVNKLTENSTKKPSNPFNNSTI